MVTGPHLHNFTDIADRMQSAGALEVGADADAVGAAIEGLLEDEGRRAAMRDAGLALVRDGRGAVRRTLAVLAADLPRPAAD